MTLKNRLTLLSTASAMALTAQSPAIAQTEGRQTAQAPSLEEIVVTARRARRSAARHSGRDHRVLGG